MTTITIPTETITATLLSTIISTATFATTVITTLIRNTTITEAPGGDVTQATEIIQILGFIVTIIATVVIETLVCNCRIKGARKQVEKRQRLATAAASEAGNIPFTQVPRPGYNFGGGSNLLG